MTAARDWYVFAGGGTGGHLYPGLSIAASLQQLRPNCDVTFFTTGRAIDEQVIKPFGYATVPQPVLPFNPRPWKWPAFLKAYRASVRDAAARFAARPPAVVLGLGGYASAPAIVAASRLRIPTAIFNPDAVPGRANRKLTRVVDIIFCQWDITWEVLNRDDRVRITGCPVRPEFVRLTREDACRALQIDPARHVLLITGASQGAASINAAATALIDFLAGFADWQIIHVTGSADFERVRLAYAERLPTAKVVDFTPKMAVLMVASDLVLSRAGASTLAELTACGRASILLPYPYDKKVHQRDNANVLAKAQAAVIVDDERDGLANARKLKPVLKDLMTSHERRRRLGRAARAISRIDAADAIAEGLVELAETRDE